MRSPSSRKSGESSQCKPKLVGANPHVAEHYATRAILQCERTCCQFVVISVDGGLAVQFHDEMASTRRDLVVVPFVARLQRYLRRRHVDDCAGAIRWIGPLIENIDLVTRCRPDLAGIRAP